MSNPEIPSAAVLKTLVLTDLVDSTKLVGELGDEQVFHLLGRHDRLARDLMAAHHGREIDKTDGFLLLFDRPLDALAYALDYHRTLRELAAGLGVRLAARAGIHLGEVFLRENPPEDVARGAKPLEVEGLAKPVAARLMSLAGAGQTLLTRTAFDLCRRAAVGSTALPGGTRWVAHGSYVLKGVDEPVEIFEAGESEHAPLKPPADSEKARRAAGDQTILGWRPSPGQDVPHRTNWVLRDKLGEGGYGEVWLAEHKKTHDRQVFKFCFETERLRSLKREATLFRLMKEALGRRDDIARILDWNFEDPPYFLEVEYTEGGSLLEWAESKGGVAGIPLPERLEIVAQVAQALSAAHSVGVLHKDIKPANILITVDREGQPRAKLTDFGIGLLTDVGQLAEYGITVVGMTDMAATRSSSTSGTVQYLAPELLEGKLPTVQADIYSLGVILYQLVVGDPQRTLAPGWERQVEDELLREDIAACVDGSPDRRLGSAAELAQRLRTLTERRASREAEQKARQAEEKARRRRRILIPVFVGVVIFAVVMAIQARRIALEADRANREAATARQVSLFLVNLFELAESAKGRGDTITAREILERGADRVRKELAGQPATQAQLMNTIGQVYLNLGLYSQAEPLIRQSLDARRKLFGDSGPETADSLDSLGLLLLRQRRYDESERTLRQALGIHERIDPQGAGAAQVLGHLAELFKQQGRHAEAQPYERRAAALLEKSGQAAAGPLKRAAAGTLEIVSLNREIDLPKDSRAMLGYGFTPGSVRVAGPDRLFLVDLDGREAPRETMLGAGEQALEGVGNAAVAIRSGRRLLIRFVFVNVPQAKDDVLLDDLDPADRVVLGPEVCALARIHGRTLQLYQPGQTGLHLLAAIEAAGTIGQVRVSQRYVAWVEDETTVKVYSLAEKKQIFQARDWEGQVLGLAFEDRLGWLAVGGWFDEVFIYDLGGVEPPRSFSAPGKTNDLLFIPDWPTLVAARDGGLLMWRDGQGIIAQVNSQAARYHNLAWGPAGLLVKDQGAQRAASFAYRSFPVRDALEIAGAEIWAMAAQPDGRYLYAGSSDGRLHRYEPASASLQSLVAHSQGLTSIVLHDREIVTASDDKTVALWDAARLELVKRSKAHGFLVNYLFWDRHSRQLWSSSSDHTLKSWRMPGLEAGEVIQAPGGAKAAFWLDGARKLALVGTWEQAWLEMRLQNGRWQPTGQQAVPGQCVYAVAEHPELKVVALLGIRPSELWIYDLVTGQAGPVELPDPSLTWICPAGADRFVLVGRGTVTTCRLQRRGDALHYAVSQNFNTDLGFLVVCAAPSGAPWVGAGSAAGKLVIFEPAALSRRIYASGQVRLAGLTGGAPRPRSPGR